jgi:hypothetical protein
MKKILFSVTVFVLIFGFSFLPIVARAESSIVLTKSLRQTYIDELNKLLELLIALKDKLVIYEKNLAQDNANLVATSTATTTATTTPKATTTPSATGGRIYDSSVNWGGKNRNNSDNNNNQDNNRNDYNDYLNNYLNSLSGYGQDQNSAQDDYIDEINTVTPNYSPADDIKASNFKPLTAEEQSQIKQKCESIKNKNGGIDVFAPANTTASTPTIDNYICVIDGDGETKSGNPVRLVVLHGSGVSASNSIGLRAVTGLASKKNTTQYQRRNEAGTGNPLPNGIYKTGSIYVRNWGQQPPQVVRLLPQFSTARTGILFHTALSNATHGCVGLFSPVDMQRILTFVKSHGSVPVYVDIK